MTEQPFQDVRISKAPYPAPPPFWQSFTTENVARLKEAESADSFDPESLPYELLLLRPSPPPSSSVASYQLFNQILHLPPQPTLPVEEERLFDYSTFSSATGPGREHVRKLRQLLKSINLNFLELYSIMGDNPVEYWEEKLRDIGLLMENFNAILNALRPHQTREQLKTMLERRLDAGRIELENMDAKKAEIEAFLGQIEDEHNARDTVKSEVKQVNGVHKHNSDRTHETNKLDVEHAKLTWDLLDTLDDD